jgi:cupin fold WbuC family metalloprotein
MKKVEPESFQELSETVYSSQGPVVRISSSEIDFLQDVAAKSPSRKARMLLHGSPDNDLHEMLIVHSFGQYIQPHINLDSAKSFLVLDGEMIVVLFNNEGEISNYVKLGVSKGASDFLLRLDDPVFHTVVPVTTTVTFLETVKGPHTQTHYAPFAPLPNNSFESEKYIMWLMEKMAIE